jgi:hypothetical protein
VAVGIQYGGKLFLRAGNRNNIVATGQLKVWGGSLTWRRRLCAVRKRIVSAALLTSLPFAVFSQRAKSLDGAYGFDLNNNVFGSGYFQFSHTWRLIVRRLNGGEIKGRHVLKRERQRLFSQ